MALETENNDMLHYMSICTRRTDSLFCIKTPILLSRENTI